MPSPHIHFLEGSCRCFEPDLVPYLNRCGYICLALLHVRSIDQKAERLFGQKLKTFDSVICDDCVSADRIIVVDFDLSSYVSILAFSGRVKPELPKLGVLIANVGIGIRKWRKTEYNEETITTNVVSTSLLAFLIHPKLRETASKYKQKPT